MKLLYSLAFECQRHLHIHIQARISATANQLPPPGIIRNRWVGMNMLGRLHCKLRRESSRTLGAERPKLDAAFTSAARKLQAVGTKSNTPHCGVVVGQRGRAHGGAVIAVHAP